MRQQGLRSFRQSSAWWLVAAIAISFVLRVPFLAVPIISDEGGYAYAAQRWFDGRGTLYRDLVFDRPQGIFLLYGVIQQTLGESVVAIRLGAWLATVATLAIVWGFTRRAAGDRAAALAAALFAVLAGSPAIEGFTANAEVFMGLPAAACALLLLKASRGGWHASPLVVAGLLAGAAALIKQSGIVLIPMAIALVGLYTPASGRLLARRWLLFGAGFGLALAPALVHGWSAGWENYVDAVAGRVNARSATSVGIGNQLELIRYLALHVWPLLVAVAFPLYAMARRGRGTGTQPLTPLTPELRFAVRLSRPQPGTEAGVLLGLWLASCFAGIAMGGNWFPHYLSQVMAPLAIWLGILIDRLFVDLSPRARREFLLPLAVVSLIPYSILATTAGDAEAMGDRLFDRTTYAEQDEIAEYLRGHTPVETPIYVAFYQASIYYLADRPASHHRLYGWELQAAPPAEDDLVAMVESPGRPLYVVDLHQVSPFADGGRRFWDVVDAHYHLETTIEGASLYRANEG